MKSRRRAIDVWCKCHKCGDMLSVTLWLRKHPDGRFRANLEPTTDARAEQGMLFHRPEKCNGILRVFELPGPTVLED